MEPMLYFIGQGTAIIRFFATLEEMFAFHKEMPDLDRHFCRLYNCEDHTMAEGWDIQYDYNDPAKWRAC